MGTKEKVTARSHRRPGEPSMESGREGGGEVKTVQTPCLLGPLPQQNLWGGGHTAGGQKVNRKEEERR